MERAFALARLVFGSFVRLGFLLLIALWLGFLCLQLGFYFLFLAFLFLWLALYFLQLARWFQSVWCISRGN